MYTVYNIHACQVSRDLEKKMGRGICIVSYIRGVVSKIDSSQNPNPHPLAAFCRMLRYYREHFILSIATCFNLGFFFFGYTFTLIKTDFQFTPNIFTTSSRECVIFKSSFSPLPTSNLICTCMHVWNSLSLSPYLSKISIYVIFFYCIFSQEFHIIFHRQLPLTNFLFYYHSTRHYMYLTINRNIFLTVGIPLHLFHLSLSSLL